VLLTNLGVVGLATLCAVVYPRVGGVLRFVGSASGLVYVFALPSLVHLRRLSLFGGEVSARQKLFHYGIVALGVVNLLLQFFI
jgi:hypothetical protein